MTESKRESKRDNKKLVSEFIEKYYKKGVYDLKLEKFNYTIEFDIFEHELRDMFHDKALLGILHEFYNNSICYGLPPDCNFYIASIRTLESCRFCMINEIAKEMLCNELPYIYAKYMYNNNITYIDTNELPETCTKCTETIYKIQMIDSGQVCFAISEHIPMLIRKYLTDKEKKIMSIYKEMSPTDIDGCIGISFDISLNGFR